jgi:hypothetical protein
MTANVAAQGLHVVAESMRRTRIPLVETTANVSDRSDTVEKGMRGAELDGSAIAVETESGIEIVYDRIEGKMNGARTESEKVAEVREHGGIEAAALVETNDVARRLHLTERSRRQI